MAVWTLPETAPAVNPLPYRLCAVCRVATPKQRVPLSGPHIHVCPAPAPDSAPVLAFFDGQLVAQGYTVAAAEQALDRHLWALVEDGLVTQPATLLGDARMAYTLADFDYPAGVTHRTVSPAELDMAARLLHHQHPANVRERQLAAEVVAAHAEQRVAFRWHAGLLEVSSWSSDGQIHAVMARSGCRTCPDARRCMHAVLYQLIAIRERGLVIMPPHSSHARSAKSTRPYGA